MNLFIFTIGPVKSLIENSRKARDMYAGSKLLSEIMREAVRWMMEKGEAQMIFPLPAEDEQDKPSNMPNRMIVSFQDKSDQFLLNNANKLTYHIRDFFLNRCMEILSKSGIQKEGLSLASCQLKGILETFWLYEPYEEGEYASAYKRLCANLMAVKGVRLFSQVNEPWGRKCSLFPEYNAIFAKKRDVKGQLIYPSYVNAGYVYDITDHERLRYAVKTKEAMSAIALVKRMYGESGDKRESNIYSIRQMLLKSRISDAIFKKLNISSGDLVANAIYDLENDNTPLEDEYDSKSLKEAGLLSQYIKENRIRLTSYYALIKFDGDSMGEAFLECKAENEQRVLSEKIEQFAKIAPSIFLKYKGLPVFAGGEDFFGFLPLDGLFDCLLELREEFFRMIERTFSMGIAIAHLMHPLKEVVAEVDKLEMAAKKTDGKNAFAMGILKRGGEWVYLPQYKLEGSCDLPSLRDINRLVGILSNCECSKALIYNICSPFSKFAEKGNVPEHCMAEVLVRESVVSSNVDYSKTNTKELVHNLMLFYSVEYGLSGFLSTMNAVSFLAREVI